MSNETATLPSSGKIKRIFQIATFAVIAAGIVLRAAKYLPAWSLWADEISIVLNLINRSMLSLMTQPMDYRQAAPMGFLATEKLLMNLFGRSEYVYRLVPFMAGIASLFFYQNLLFKTLNKYAALFTLSAFAFGNYLIYYSVEVKQYSTDVFIAIILSILFHEHIQKQEPNNRDFAILGAAGFLALLFSHPAIFLLVSIGITLVIQHFRDRTRLVKTLFVGSLWAGTFAALYLMLLRKQVTSEYLIVFWGNLLSYMPMPPWRDFSWFYHALNGLYFTVGGISGGLILILSISLLGAWSFIKHRQWQWVVYIVVVVGLNMAVSGFQKFPFHGRLILYLVPLVFLMLGRGVHALTTFNPHPGINILILTAITIIVLRPAVQTTNSFLFSKDYVRSDLKSVLGYMQENIENEDAVYQYHRAGRLFPYYAADYGLQGLTVYAGENHSDKAKLYDSEIENLPRGKRIWFLFTFVGKTKIMKQVKQDEREYILNLLRDSGTLLTEYYGTNDSTSAHLFILK